MRGAAATLRHGPRLRPGAPLRRYARPQGRPRARRTCGACARVRNQNARNSTPKTTNPNTITSLPPPPRPHAAGAGGADLPCNAPPRQHSPPPPPTAPTPPIRPPAHMFPPLQRRGLRGMANAHPPHAQPLPQWRGAVRGKGRCRAEGRRGGGACEPLTPRSPCTGQQAAAHPPDVRDIVPPVRPPSSARCTAPLCDIPSCCCFFTGPWTVTRSSLRMLRRVAAFCRPLRPVLLLVSFPRSRSPVFGAVLDVAWCAVCTSAAPNSWRMGGCAGCCWGHLTVFAVHAPLSTGRP